MKEQDVTTLKRETREFFFRAFEAKDLGTAMSYSAPLPPYFTVLVLLSPHVHQ